MWADVLRRPKGPDPLQTSGIQGESALEALERIKRSIETLADPDGSKEAPAKSCKDIAMSYPDSKDGVYWVDPNAGSSEDAIRVYCKIKSNQTCFHSLNKEVIF